MGCNVGSASYNEAGGHTCRETTPVASRIKLPLSPCATILLFELCPCLLMRCQCPLSTTYIGLTLLVLSCILGSLAVVEPACWPNWSLLLAVSCILLMHAGVFIDNGQRSTYNSGQCISVVVFKYFFATPFIPAFSMQAVLAKSVSLKWLLKARLCT